MKKIFSVVSMLLLVGCLYSYQEVVPYMDDYNSILVPQTSGFIDICSLGYSADSDSATLKVFVSSVEVKIASLTAGGDTFNTEKTIAFNLNSSTEDTLGELYARILENDYLTANIVKGCFLNQTSSPTYALTSEGKGDGLWWGGTTSGKSYGNILSSTKTIWCNAVSSNAYYCGANDIYALNTLYKKVTPTEAYVQPFVGAVYSTATILGTAPTTKVMFYQFSNFDSIPEKISQDRFNQAEFHYGTGIKADAGKILEVRIERSTFTTGVEAFEVHKGKGR